jgi:high-affinity iron transporter
MLLAMLREGIEILLITAIVAAYLGKTGRRSLLPAIWWGVSAAVLASIVLGVGLPQIAVHPVWEGTLAAIAALLVISMTIYLLKSAIRRRRASEEIQPALEPSGTAAWVAVFLFILLMTAREGIEFVYVSTTFARNAGSGAAIAGALVGLLAATGLAAGFAGYGRRMRVHLFFQVSCIFLVLFALHLLLYAFDSFTKAGAVPLIDNARWHATTKEWVEGRYAQAVHLVLVIAPMAWLCYATYSDPRSRQSEQHRAGAATSPPPLLRK